MIGIDDSKRGELADRWKNAVKKHADPNTKALAFKGNYRIKLSSAFAAVFHSAVAALKGAAIAHANPLALFELAADVFAAVVAAVDAVRERMMPAEFIVCIALAPEATTQNDLEKTVRAFLEADPKLFPWYLGIDDALLNSARKQLHSAEDFQDVVDKLIKDGRVEREAATGRLRFIERNVELGMNIGTAG